MSKSNRGTTTERNRLRQACFNTYGRSCFNCGNTATEVDHIIELAAGGDNTLDNVQPLCKPCHKIKTATFNSKYKGNKRNDQRNGVFSEAVAPPTLFRAYLSPLRKITPPGG